MTLVWVAAALSALLWPPAGESARRQRESALRAGGRLASVAERAPFTGRRRADSQAPGTRRPVVAGSLVVGAGAAAVLVLCLVVVVSPAMATGAAVTVAVVLAVAQAVVRQLAGGRRRARHERDVLLALALLIGELEAGTTPPAALRVAGAIGVDIERRLAVGVGADRAGDNRAGDSRTGDNSAGNDPIARVVAGWRVSETAGVPLVELLRRIRADLAARAATRRLVASAVAGPQASAAVLAGLPVLGVGLGTAMGADPFGVLLGSTAGLTLLCVGMILDALGVLWAIRLVERAQR